MFALCRGQWEVDVDRVQTEQQQGSSKLHAGPHSPSVISSGRRREQRWKQQHLVCWPCASSVCALTCVEALEHFHLFGLISLIIVIILDSEFAFLCLWQNFLWLSSLAFILNTLKSLVTALHQPLEILYVALHVISKIKCNLNAKHSKYPNPRNTKTEQSSNSQLVHGLCSVPVWEGITPYQQVAVVCIPHSRRETKRGDFLNHVN